MAEQSTPTNGNQSQAIYVGPNVVELRVDTSKPRHIKVSFKNKRGALRERILTISEKGKINMS